MKSPPTPGIDGKTLPLFSQSPESPPTSVASGVEDSVSQNRDEREREVLVSLLWE